MRWLSRHGDLSSNPQQPHKSQAWWLTSGIPAWGQKREDAPDAQWLASLTVGIDFIERPCLKL